MYRPAIRPEWSLSRGIAGAQAGHRSRSPASSAAAATVVTATQRDVIGVAEATLLRGVDGVRRWHHAHPRLILRSSSSSIAEQQPAVHAGEGALDRCRGLLFMHWLRLGAPAIYGSAVHLRIEALLPKPSALRKHANGAPSR